MSAEIGSNFYSVELSEKHSENKKCDVIYSFSGRTSLFQVINHVMKEKKVSSACLPSYLCESMIEPFIASGIDSISFYDVYIENSSIKIDLDSIGQSDIILTMNYFGAGTEETQECEKRIRESHRKAVIIKDITHSMLKINEQGRYADYMFGSIRKWSGFADGGIALKNGGWDENPYNKVNEEHFSILNEARKNKKIYIEYGRGDKQQFLDLFGKAEEILDRNYREYAINPNTAADLKRFNAEKVSGLRRINYRRLLSGEKIMMEKNILPLFPVLMDCETPLFFPVIAENREKRDRLRKYLTGNGVYCPVHWPISCMHMLSDRTREIYDRELSIICDQRYTEKDMLRILMLIEEYTEK